MTQDVLEMRIVRCGASTKGKVIVTNSFPRKRDPNTGKLLDVYVCKDGILLREDGVVIERDGTPAINQDINPEEIEISMGELLEDVPHRNNLPGCFVWKYQNGGYHCG